MGKGGLRQGSDDYEGIYNKFWNDEPGYDIDNYDGDSIFSSTNDFIAQYDKRQFKYSVGRLVQKIKEAKSAEVNAPSDPFEPPASAAPAVAPAVTPKRKAPAKKAATPKPAAAKPKSLPPTPASVGGIPADYAEIVTNDELVMSIPNVLFSWKDKQENDRVTAVLYLPLGMGKEMVAPRIADGGQELVVEIDWPDIMTNPLLPMYAGTDMSAPFYTGGHVKVISFKESVRHLKGNVESKKMKSVFRKELPTMVEEQFCPFDVPAPLAAIKYKVHAPGGQREQTAVALICEMMVVRTNYKQNIEIDDFEIDFGSLTI